MDLRDQEASSNPEPECHAAVDAVHGGQPELSLARGAPAELASRAPATQIVPGCPGRGCCLWMEAPEYSASASGSGSGSGWWMVLLVVLVVVAVASGSGCSSSDSGSGSGSAWCFWWC